MELDRPHRQAPSTTSDLFICFTSRLSKSSAMRVSSKSPGRTDKPPISLSASLSRRLRNKNGSLKGGQSPMFPPQGLLHVSKKRGGCGIENPPEPSSPKVTCIGQVRVKTKKHGKKMKMNMSRAYRGRRSTGGSGDHHQTQSMQRGGGGGGEFGEGCLQHRNQRWVHLPIITICDAFKGLGSEFNSCFSPCRPSSCCTSSAQVNKGNRQQVQNREEDNISTSSSCGGSVCRWLVSLHEGEGRTRDIELVVGEEEEERVVMERECSRRRSIFDDMDFNIDEICQVGNHENAEEEQQVEEEAARVSICIPPKNALLLMRCRSDPVKMKALSTKFWEQVAEEEGMGRRRSSVSEYEKIEALVPQPKKVEALVPQPKKIQALVPQPKKIEALSSCAKEEEEEQKRPEEEKEKSPLNTESQVEEEEEEDSEEQQQQQQQQSAGAEMCEELIQEEKLQQQRLSVDHAVEDLGVFVEDPNQAIEQVESPDQVEEAKELNPFEIEIDQQTIVGKVSIFEQSEEETQPPPLKEEEEEEEDDDDTMEEEEEEAGEEEEVGALPDCLLLMMCEPKLSMEVSKETWVCSTDFIRCLPERHRQHHLKKINPTTAGDESTTTTNNNNNNKKKNRANSTAKSKPPPPPPPAQLPPQPQGFQPPRSSCSFPISGGVKEKKRVAYEPFALTRCKSAPMRSATAKLASAPELACSWKNRKIEPHRPATCGVGAAGIGC